MAAKVSVINTASAVNVDPSDIATGQSVVNFIVAQATAARRARHLERKIQSIQFDREKGVGVLVDDDGARQHLANALKFDPKVTKLRPRREGTPYCRTGTIFGIEVTIWNVEV